MLKKSKSYRNHYNCIRVTLISFSGPNLKVEKFEKIQTKPENLLFFALFFCLLSLA